MPRDVRDQCAGFRARPRFTPGFRRRDMGDLNQSGVPNQADINAQLLAGPAQLTAAMSAMTEQLARLEQGNRPNGLRPRGRNHPYLADRQLTQTRTSASKGVDKGKSIEVENLFKKYQAEP
ncbi:hypothetical protein DY000_02031759 [Brassica cretica]|uniref:Uncharacterized protein n=1 Tax=Brassica cretica TaxID=69181 RepID=A0ABQ7DMB2_BRACR|nr:hypothetical protein DY000_02031759 [Brassica cretica]